MQISKKIAKVNFWRILVQWLFLGWCIVLGVQFAVFVRYYENGGLGPYFSRPPGVEGFLPIGALASLKAWLTSGYFDRLHPAALVLFLTFLAMALLARKSFCSWLCPVGTLEEGLWKLGKRIFGRNFRIWSWLDILLRFCKYALLLFFAKLILLDMPTQALRGFLNSPYWKIADVRMLHFFTGMSLTSLTVIIVLAVLSVFYQNFWCRFLCPYGALLGLLSWFSPVRVLREQNNCTDCGRCSQVCPARLAVAEKTAVLSVECTGCLTCVSNCPEPGALQVSVWKKPIPSWGFALLVVVLFCGGILLGKATGHWHSSLNHAEYLQLIPLADRLGF